MKFDDSKLMLMCNSAHGIYVPQMFFKANIEQIKIWCDTEDHKFEYYRELNSPDNEFYWDTWSDFLNNYSFQHPLYGKCILGHHEDLWAYPEAMDIPEDFWP